MPPHDLLFDGATQEDTICWALDTQKNAVLSPNQYLVIQCIGALLGRLAAMRGSSCWGTMCTFVVSPRRCRGSESEFLGYQFHLKCEEWIARSWLCHPIRSGSPWHRWSLRQVRSRQNAELSLRLSSPIVVIYSHQSSNQRLVWVFRGSPVLLPRCVTASAIISPLPYLHSLPCAAFFFFCFCITNKISCPSLLPKFQWKH